MVRSKANKASNARSGSFASGSTNQRSMARHRLISNQTSGFLETTMSASIAVRSHNLGLRRSVTERQHREDVCVERIRRRNLEPINTAMVRKPPVQMLTPEEDLARGTKKEGEDLLMWRLSNSGPYLAQPASSLARLFPITSTSCCGRGRSNMSRFVI